MALLPTTLENRVGTPSLVVERQVFESNLAAMGAVRPGRTLRPHVKAFKSTALAARLAERGHEGGQPVGVGVVRRRAAGVAGRVVGDHAEAIAQRAHLGPEVPGAPGEAVGQHDGRPGAALLDVERHGS